MFKFSPVTVKLENIGTCKSDGAQHMEDLLNRTQNPYELEDYISRNGENGVLKWTEGGDNFQVSVITEGNKKKIEVLDLSTAALTGDKLNKIKMWTTPPDFVFKTMVPIVSDITEANDYQNLAFMNAKGVFNFTGCMTISPVGKSINDLLAYAYSFDDNTIKFNNTKTYLGRMVQAGLGEQVVVEIIEDPKTGFDAVVLQDPEGNYSIYFQNTNQNEMKDLIHDGLTYISEKSSNTLTSFFNVLTGIPPISSAVTGLPPGISDMALLPLCNIETSQNILANALALKYAMKANQTGKKINIYAYSLGGSSAETAIWNLEQEGYGDKIANVTLINPLHAALPEKAIEYMYDLNEDGRLSIYANEQDIVHKHNLEDELTPITKYIDLGLSKTQRDLIKADDADTKMFLLSRTIGLGTIHTDDAITSDPTLVSEYFDITGKFKGDDYTYKMSGDIYMPDNVC